MNKLTPEHLTTVRAWELQIGMVLPRDNSIMDPETIVEVTSMNKVTYARTMRWERQWPDNATVTIVSPSQGASETP